MAQPADSAFTLGTVSEAIFRQYFPTFLRQVFFSSAQRTNRLIAPENEPVTGDGKYYKFKTASGDYTRVNTSMLADVEQGRSWSAKELKLRFDALNAASNDFTRLAYSIRVSDLEVRGLSSGGSRSIVDVVTEALENASDDYMFKLACMRHLDRTGSLCAISGTKKLNDAFTMTDASAYSNGSTSFRAFITSGSPARIQVGYEYDIYDTSGNLVLNNVVATDPSNVGDTTDGTSTGQASVAFALTSRSLQANCDSVASTNLIYFTGTRNSCPYSLGSWLTYPSTSDSFIGGVNRTSSGNRYLLPHFVGRGQTTRTIDRSIFDTMADQHTNRADDGNLAAVAIMEPRLHTTLRRAIGEEALKLLPADDETSRRDGTFGLTGLKYIHPAFPTGVVLYGDPIATQGVVRVIRPQDWRMACYGSSEPYFPPGEQGKFYRVSSSTPGAGKSLFWQADGYMMFADFCQFPGRQIVIDALQP